MVNDLRILRTVIGQVESPTEIEFRNWKNEQNFDNLDYVVNHSINSRLKQHREPFKSGSPQAYQLSEGSERIDIYTNRHNNGKKYCKVELAMRRPGFPMAMFDDLVSLEVLDANGQKILAKGIKAQALREAPDMPLRDFEFNLDDQDTGEALIEDFRLRFALLDPNS